MDKADDSVGGLKTERLSERWCCSEFVPNSLKLRDDQRNIWTLCIKRLNTTETTPSLVITNEQGIEFTYPGQILEKV
jgi:hypothetical protein